MSAMDADVERLVRLSEEELAAYVRTRLLGRATAPMVVWSKGETPSPFLVYAYRESADPDFQARLRRVVNRLLRAWAPAAGDKVEYGARLMRLAGQLRIEDGADLLASLAFDPALDGLATDGELISSLALGTLLDFPGQEWRTDFWEPLWRDDPISTRPFSPSACKAPGTGCHVSVTTCGEPVKQGSRRGSSRRGSWPWWNRPCGRRATLRSCGESWRI